MLFILFITTFFLQEIGEKIWINECQGKREGLTHWNKGEEFASLGIGHFIWYPETLEKKFQETFPDLLNFMQKEGVTIPPWLSCEKGCPWKSREAFLQEDHSQRMEELRTFLYDTKDIQAKFMLQRMQESLPKIVANLEKEQQRHITTLFEKLAATPRGQFALIDYVNFKGLGISERERYRGQGWGLLQVLQRLSVAQENLEEAFIAAAIAVLKERVENARPEREEGQWLQGWINRVRRY